MKHTHEISAERVILKPLMEKDIEPLRLLRNQEENRKWFNFSLEISQEAQRTWYKRYLTIKNDFTFAVFSNGEPEMLLGMVALYNLENREAEFGRILIDNRKTGHRGLGLEVTNAILKFGFSDLRLHRIYLEVFANNERALLLYRKAGFKVTGQKNNKIYMQMTKEE